MTATDQPPMDDGPAPATPGEPRRRPSGGGCLVKLVFFVVMVVLGALAASLLRDRDTSDRVTLAEGTAGTVEFTIEARTDDAQARCIELYVGDDDFALTGGCIAARAEPAGVDVQEASPAGTDFWVVFGFAPPGADGVELPLTNGTTETVDVEEEGGESFYVLVPPEGVHADEPAVFLDAEGNRLAA